MIFEVRTTIAFIWNDNGIVSNDYDGNDNDYYSNHDNNDNCWQWYSYSSIFIKIPSYKSLLAWT